MKHINGENNEITFIFPHDRIDCISSNTEFNQIISQANITITGNNNHISMCFDSKTVRRNYCSATDFS